MKEDEYREKDIKIKKEQLKWIQLQVIMTMFLTMIAVIYTIASFGKQYPDLGTSIILLIAVIVIGCMMILVARKAAKNNS